MDLFLVPRGLSSGSKTGAKRQLCLFFPYHVGQCDDARSVAFANIDVGSMGVGLVYISDHAVSCLIPSSERTSRAGLELASPQPSAPHDAGAFCSKGLVFSLLVKVYRNKPSLLKTGRSSSTTSVTVKAFLAFLRNCMSARLLFLKQK